MKEKEKKIKEIKAKLSYINDAIEMANLDLQDIGSDERIKCIRIMSDGTIEYYNCKTGEVVK